MAPKTLGLAYVLLVSVVVVQLMAGCSSTYYGAMEKVGIPKREIMVDRVEDARDSQADAQGQFTSALDQFNSVVKLEETDLKKAYDRLNDEYEDCKKAAENVSSRIAKVEDVSDALFDEWQDELAEYQSAELRRSSKEKLQDTRFQYKEMLASMHQAERSMQPVLAIFHDNVLYLKHNLNAQAIGSLEGEFNNLKGEIDKLIAQMNEAIAESNKFIAEIQ